jgi:oxygen-independent coproporphyrinogen III oxidase
VRHRLQDVIASGEYLSYAYSYPHKTAYRTLDPPADLSAEWATEDRSALFLYLHVPFCEQRCGFCNLFTQSQPKGGIETRYVAAVERQAAAIEDALGAARFARLAVGGGTPTYLEAALLDRLLRVAARLGAAGVPSSIEVSPSTLDAEKVAILVAHRVTRVSMGVQSVVPAETEAVHRHQSPASVDRSLVALADAIPIRNVDLIYGLPGQTSDSLGRSIDHVRGLGANEIYLYPLYVRPLTTLGRTRRRWDDHRVALYRAGRDHLRDLGWQQRSMRRFTAPKTSADDGPAYRCQDDGMVGLGAGARSYTRTLHYATPFAVGQREIRSRIEAWIDQPDADLRIARHGYRLDVDEQRRRYVLLSLLDEGVERASYRARFGDDVLAHLPELREALEVGFVLADDAALRLTERGLDHSDVLGDWLQSPAVRAGRATWLAS